MLQLLYNRLRGVTDMKRMKKIRVMLLAVLWLAAMAMMGCRKDDSHSEQSAKAILESFLSCSVQDVQKYQDTYSGLTSEAVGDQTYESGITFVDGLEQYFRDKYGDIMTDECIESMIDNRTIIQSMKLAEKYDSNIVSKDIWLTKKAGTSETYTYEATVAPTSNQENETLITGAITVTGEKASYLTIGVKGVN